MKLARLLLKYSIFHVDVAREKPAFLNRISLEARTVKKPGFWGVFHKPGIGCIPLQSL
jgi:hypothetical protein